MEAGRSGERATARLLEVMLRGLCEPARLLDLVENFTLFSEHKTRLIKAIAQNHQYLGVNNAMHATLAARAAGKDLELGLSSGVVHIIRTAKERSRCDINSSGEIL